MLATAALIDPADRRRSIAFASELSAVRRASRSDRLISATTSSSTTCAFGIYLRNKATIYRGMEQRRPLHTWRSASPVDDASLTAGTRVTNSDRVSARRRRLSARRLRSHAIPSTRRQAVAPANGRRRPVGCFLSGGVDSSVVAAAWRARPDTVRRSRSASTTRATTRSAYAAGVGTTPRHRPPRVSRPPTAAEDLPEARRGLRRALRRLLRAPDSLPRPRRRERT